MTEPMNPDAIRRSPMIIDMQPDRMPGGDLPAQAPPPADAAAPAGVVLEAANLQLQVAMWNRHPLVDVCLAGRDARKRSPEEISPNQDGRPLRPGHCLQVCTRADQDRERVPSRLAAIIRNADDAKRDSCRGSHNKSRVLRHTILRVEPASGVGVGLGEEPGPVGISVLDRAACTTHRMASRTGPRGAALPAMETAPPARLRGAQR
jgi:hypothetical protein